MRYIPRKSLWKALLFGFFLLSISYPFGIIGGLPGNVRPVQASNRQPVSRVNFQAPDGEYAIYLPLAKASNRQPVQRVNFQAPDGEYAIYLPSVIQPPRVELSDVWTADEYRTPKEAFLPGKVIRYYAQGYVNIPDVAIISLRWTVNGPCGNKILFDGSGQIHQGQWTLFQTDIATNCPGVYTYTLRMAYRDEVKFDTVSYAVNHPSEVVSLNQQGFDKCNIPYGSKTESINQMQTWWNLSPYFSVNLYIGGISRYCSNSELDAVWVNQVAKQGWSFIPTWVGPQAPCSNYRYRFSSSPNTAYQQGRLEADAAFETNRNLGFLGNTVIYYDMEMYSTTNLACRDAVNSFLAGWSQRLQEYGVRSGVYGHRVNVNDWATIAYPGTPHNVWIASWIRSTYDPGVTAYGIPGISDNLWRDQRIRQYAGDHVEYYGGIGFSIDSNIMDGEVTALPNLASSAAPLVDSGQGGGQAEQVVNISSARNPQINDFQLVSNDRGLAIIDERLLWTNDGGSEWLDITPPSAEKSAIMAAEFIDEMTGWTVSQDPLTGQMNLMVTSNSGRDWSVLPLIEGDELTGPLASAVYLELLDEQAGWVVVRLVSSANFKTGRMFHTKDGGRSWEEYGVPFGEPVKFLDQERGWIAGGPAENQLFYTPDGGRTWVEQEPNSILPLNTELFISSLQTGASLNGNLPEGTVKAEIKPDGQGWVHVERTQCGGIKLPPLGGYSFNPGSFRCEKQSSILSTPDGGESWVDITP